MRSVYVVVLSTSPAKATFGRPGGDSTSFPSLTEAYPRHPFPDIDKQYGWRRPCTATRFGLETGETSLGHSTARECQPLIAQWLKDEVRFLPPESIGSAVRVMMGISEKNVIKEGARYERIIALIHAAGDGKNELALPVLRKILKRGLYDYSADYAVGRIGKDEDLEWFVVQLEKGDRSLRMRLSEFGPLAIRRIMQEVGNPAVPKDVSGRLRFWIGDVRTGPDTTSTANRRA